MMEERLTHLAERLTLPGGSRERIRAALAAQSGGRAAGERRRPSGLRFVLALAAALALLTVTALALFPSLREWMLADLGPRAPYATQVLGSCEDLGITIQAQSALTDGRVTRLYFTVHDPSGTFFLEDTENDLNMDFLAGEKTVWSMGGEGLELLSYDPDTQTGLYAYSRGTYREYGTDAVPSPTHARVTMSYFLPGNRLWWGERFSGPVPFGKPDLPVETLETTTENGAVVLLPDQTPHNVDENYPEVYISAMGFDGEGRYHVRLHAEPGIVSAYTDDGEGSPFWVGHDLLDGEHQQTFDDAAIVTQVSDGWDYCLTSLTRETYERMGTLFVMAHYSMSGGYRWGEWELTVPIQAVEGQSVLPENTVILSHTKDSLPLLGQSDEAQVAEVFLSPLGVTVDFVTPEGHEFPCSISGEETECIVEFAGGVRVVPSYNGSAWLNRRGWIAWEFPEPIEPEKVVSVSLNGNVIPFEA